MSLKTKSICLMAKARISPIAEQSANELLALIRSALPAALNTFGESIANSPKRRLLQKEFDFAIMSESVSLSTAFSANEPLLLPFDPMTGMYVPFTACRVNGNDAYFISDRQTMALKELDDDLTYYTIENQIIYFASQEDIPDSSDLAIIGNYVPGIISGSATGTINIGTNARLWTGVSGYVPTSADIGGQITIQGALISGDPLVTTIASIPSPGSATLTDPATASVTGAATIVGDERINVPTEFQDDIVNALIRTYLSEQTLQQAQQAA